MPNLNRTASPLVLFLSLATAAAAEEKANRVQPDPPKTCDACEAWNAKREPFKVFGNTYYVGVAGISSVLITSNDGHVLLDGGLPQSAPLIEQNIRALGFNLKDVRLMVASHEHFDHVGGIAALQRASGATVVASAPAAEALGKGEPTAADPQYGTDSAVRSFPAVQNVRTVSDGEGLRIGGIKIVAQLTPGHTPGSTTWTWRSCEESRCLDVVYADSLKAVSSPGFKFSQSTARVESFRESIALVRELPCDILIPVHPEFANMDKKLEERAAGAQPDPFINSEACQAYADAAEKLLERRLKEER